MRPSAVSQFTNHEVSGRTEAACFQFGPLGIRPSGNWKALKQVNWNSLTLTVLAVFGLLSLVVTLLIQLIKQLPELIRAVREMLSALTPDDKGDESTTETRESERPVRQEVGGEPSQERDQDEAA